MACAELWEAGASDAAPATSSSEMPSTKPLATLSFSSSTMRWASLGPTPDAALNALWSPAEMASATRSGSMTLRMARPTLGPTPDTAVSISKQACCSSVAKPYRLTSFSVTLITV